MGSFLDRATPTPYADWWIRAGCFQIKVCVCLSALSVLRCASPFGYAWPAGLLGHAPWPVVPIVLCCTLKQTPEGRLGYPAWVSPTSSTSALTAAGNVTFFWKAVGGRGRGEWVMQREERFAISKPPPIFFWILSMLLLFVLLIALIVYWPESGMSREGVLYELKGQFRGMFQEVADAFEHLVRSMASLVRLLLPWMAIFVTVWLPLLWLLVRHRRRQARSPL